MLQFQCRSPQKILKKAATLNSDPSWWSKPRNIWNQQQSMKNLASKIWSLKKNGTDERFLLILWELFLFLCLKDGEKDGIYSLITKLSDACLHPCLLPFLPLNLHSPSLSSDQALKSPFICPALPALTLTQNFPLQSSWDSFLFWFFSLFFPCFFYCKLNCWSQSKVVTFLRLLPEITFLPANSHVTWPEQVLIFPAGWNVL